MTERLPALPEPSDLATVDGAAMLAQVRGAIALLTVDDLPGMGNDVQGLAALASAARRVTLADGAELDWSEAARTAERRLGQLLDEGRECGKVAAGKRFSGKAEPTLEDLGIGYNLAADAAALGRLDDDHWKRLVEQARERKNLSRGPLAGTARSWLAEIERHTERVERARLDALANLEDAKREAERRRREIKRLTTEMAELADQLVEPPAPTEQVPEPDLTPLPYDGAFAPPEPVVLDPEDVPWSAGSTVAQLQAHQDVLRSLSTIKRQLRVVADGPLAERADTDAMLLAGIRGAVAHIVAAAHQIADRYNDHLTATTPLRSVK